jgi:hypothetical protein
LSHVRPRPLERTRLSSLKKICTLAKSARSTSLVATGIIRSLESTLPALGAVYLALSSLRAGAQLVGCDAVICPLNDYGVEYCPIWNITATSIGIANFSSALSPEPLTWTMTVSSSAGPANSLLGVYQQGYYLGTRPSLNLQETRRSKGAHCSSKVSHQAFSFCSHPSTEVGTCQDALGSSCVSDLMSQVNRKFSELMKAANATSDICSDLETALRNSAPRTCNATHGGPWGTINVKSKEDVSR